MLNRQRLARVWAEGCRARLPFGCGEQRWSLAGATALAMITVVFLSACSGSSGGTKNGFSVPNPYSQGGGVDDVRVNTLLVFGDSYSVPSFRGTPTWPAFLSGSGTASNVTNYAVGGARAAPTGQTRSFGQQVAAWLGSQRPIGDGDLTVAYFGYNDIGRRGNADGFAAARAGYEQTVAALIANGAASENRRLFVTQIHDWASNPGVPDGLRQQVVDWNAFVASQANANNNVTAVDLFTVFDRVRANPQQFGFANVTTVDASRAAIDALYLDDIHFGPKGQALIARTYRHYLTRAWDWSNRTRAGAESARKLGQDLDRGLLNLHIASGGKPIEGLRVQGFGEMSADPLASRMDGQGVSGFDHPGAAQYGESGARESRSTGFMVDYVAARDGHGSGSRFGLSMAQYNGSLEARNFEGGDRTDYVSDAMALYWQRNAAGLLATTQLSFLRHEFDGRGSDDLLGLLAVNQGGGETWTLGQRISRPSEIRFATIVPWASLSYESHRLAPGTASSLYTSDVRFGGVRATDWIGQFGLDMQLNPIRFAGGKSLVLSGTVQYLTSLDRDQIDVAMIETAVPGVVQRERVGRDRMYQAGLGFGASLNLARDLDLDATLVTSAVAQGGVEHSVSVGARYRF